MKKLIAAIALTIATTPASAITPMLEIIPTLSTAEEGLELMGVRCGAVYLSAAQDTYNTPNLEHMTNDLVAYSNTFIEVGMSAIQKRSAQDLSFEQGTEIVKERIEILLDAYEAEKQRERTLHGTTSLASTFWMDMELCKGLIPTAEAFVRQFLR